MLKLMSKDVLPMAETLQPSLHSGYSNLFL